MISRSITRCDATDPAMRTIDRETNWFWQQGYGDAIDGQKAEIPDEARNMFQRCDYFDGYDAGREDRKARDDLTHPIC